MPLQWDQYELIIGLDRTSGDDRGYPEHERRGKARGAPPTCTDVLQ